MGLRRRRPEKEDEAEEEEEAAVPTGGAALGESPAWASDAGDGDGVSDDDDQQCTVCGEATSFEDNQIVFCEGCEMGGIRCMGRHCHQEHHHRHHLHLHHRRRLPHHQVCYGIDTVPDEVVLPAL